MRALLVAAALLLGAAGTGSGGIASTPVSRMSVPWWKARFVAKEAELRRAPVAMLWLGDSITQDWERSGSEPWEDFRPVWDRYYGDRRAVDLGFKGDSTCHLLWRLTHGELDGIHPKLAVLLIGANNFGHVHTDAAATFDGIMTILDLLRAREPEMRVIVLGVLPSVRSPWVDANTVRLNAMLATHLSGRPGVRFVDAGAAVETNGRADPAKFLDRRLAPPGPPLHPDAGSQARIAAIIEPLVAADLGDAPRRF